MPQRDWIFLGCQSGVHDWQFMGGANAGCGEDCSCSIPVHKCAKCGDYDYGINLEADEVRQACAGWRD